MFKRLFRPVRNKLVRIGIAFLLVLIHLGLTRTSYRRMSKLLIALSPSPALSQRDMKRAAQVARLVNSVAASSCAPCIVFATHLTRLVDFAMASPSQ